MITKFKLFENHLDIDPYGEEDWDDSKPFIKWLKLHYPDENSWNKITKIDCSDNQLTSLEGIENLTKLEILYCWNNLFSDEYKQYLKKLKIENLYL